MAKKKRKTDNRDRRPRERERREPDETRAAEFVTVAWMLSTLVTLAAECLAGVGFLLLDPPADPDDVRLATLLPALLLYISIITGIVCLLLSPITHRVRKVPPPRSVTVVAAIIGSAPLVTLVVLSIV